MTGLERSPHLTILSRAAGPVWGRWLPLLYDPQWPKIATFFRERMGTRQETRE